MKANLPIGLNERPFPLTLSPAAFHLLLMQGVVVDGRGGGVILGRGYEEGGIYVVHQRGEDFFIHACVQGGEFVLNKDASCINLRRLVKMNAGLTLNESVPEEDPQAIVKQFIITHGEPDDKLLWLNWNQVVVASEPAEMHMAELVAMNEAANPYMVCNFRDLFPPDDGTEDGIV